MKSNTISYLAGSLNCKGYFATPDAANTPLVLIAPTFEGMNQFAKDQAHALVNQGYAAFVIDLYGDGKQASSQDEAGRLMMPLFIDRKLLLERMHAAYETAKALPGVDSSRIAAMGFCFGGLCAIELLKSGALLKATVSFHGVLGDHLMGHSAKKLSKASQIHGALLILHGYKDTLVPMDDLLQLQKEMSDSHVDWQTIIYGSAAHAFTNPEVHDAANGMCYDPLSCKRSMMTLHNFLKESFYE